MTEQRLKEVTTKGGKTSQTTDPATGKVRGHRWTVEKAREASAKGVAGRAAAKVRRLLKREED